MSVSCRAHGCIFLSFLLKRQKITTVGSEISHFTENDKKKVPWAVVYQNDGLRWISPGEVRYAQFVQFKVAGKVH